MDFEKYTEKARQAVVDCQDTALEYGHQQVDGEHLLLALLKQDQGLTSKLLSYMQVPVESFIGDVQA